MVGIVCPPPRLVEYCQLICQTIGFKRPPASQGSVGPNQEKSAADVYRQQCNEVCVCYMRSSWGDSAHVKGSLGFGGTFLGEGESIITLL